MATTIQANQFKLDLFFGRHKFSAAGGLAYKALLIKSGATGAYDKTLANVGTPGAGAPSVANVGTDEVSTAGYVSGGFALTNVDPALFTDTAVVTFSANPSWGPAATISAIAMVIYTNDATLGTAGRVVAIFDFGGTQSIVGGTFTVTLPAAGAATGLIRSL